MRTPSSPPPAGPRRQSGRGPARTVLLGAVLAAPGLAMPQGPVPTRPRRAGFQVIDAPCPRPKAFFGQSTVGLDMDGVGLPDVAVGAWGEGAVYVFHGAEPGRRAYSRVDALQYAGPVSCGVKGRSDKFGWKVVAGQLDGDAAQELVVGAPGFTLGSVAEAGLVFLFGGPAGLQPLRIGASSTAPEWLGCGLAVGDFDGDGINDVAAGAPRALVGGVAAGSVHVFFGPFDGTPPPELVLPNPFPVLDGFFGVHLAKGDANGDGLDDLYVTAIGNDASGIPVAGQVFHYPGPVDPASWTVIEDPFPNPSDLPSPRFGMYLDARADLVAVGAPRKDWAGVFNSGLGFTARGPGFPVVNVHPYPAPRDNDLFGFRIAIADVVGDDTLDVTFALLGTQFLPNPNPRALVTWDGNALLGPPARVRVMLEGSADHFANGLSAAQLAPGGKEELIVGDPSWDRPGTGKQDDVGRVVIYHY